MNPGDFYAEGSPKFVASAAIGNAIGTAVNQAATFSDCMMAVGYTPRSGAATTAVDPGASPLVGSVGAFAYDENSGKYGFSQNQQTESQADAAALKGCASNACKVVFRVGPNQCGAFATTEDGKVWGGARRDQRNAADSAAIGNCQKRTTAQCKIHGSECNR
jgi:hypothetical protein